MSTGDKHPKQKRPENETIALLNEEIKVTQKENRIIAKKLSEVIKAHNRAKRENKLAGEATT